MVLENLKILKEEEVHLLIPLKTQAQVVMMFEQNLTVVDLGRFIY